LKKAPQCGLLRKRFNLELPNEANGTNPAENSEVGLNQVGVEWTGRLKTETSII
jgi:hypothetical protein